MSAVSQSIPSNLSIDLRFLVSVQDGTTVTDISDAYLGSPAPLSVATDEGDVSGNPLGGAHQAIQAAASVAEMPLVPSMSAIGLLVMTAAFIGAGARKLRRRKQV